jgi:hypothetical protein
LLFFVVVVLLLQFDDVEVRRGDLLRAELQRLVTRLTDIAYVLPPEIERLLNKGK